MLKLTKKLNKLRSNVMFISFPSFLSTKMFMNQLGSLRFETDINFEDVLAYFTHLSLMKRPSIFLPG